MGAVGPALRKVPSGITILSGRKHPSLAGSSGAVKILRELFPKIEEVSKLVLMSSEADILSSCYLTDSCSIFQETIDGKIFKS